MKSGGSRRICISDLRHKPSRFIVTDRGRDADTLYGCPALPASESPIALPRPTCYLPSLITLSSHYLRLQMKFANAG